MCYSKIYKYASLSRTRLTLRQLLSSQNILKKNENNTKYLLSNANFLKHELSIRLSKRVVQFKEFSKYNIFNTTNILKLYTESSNKLISHSLITSENELIQFKELVKNIKNKHKNVADQLSTNLIYKRDELSNKEKRKIDTFLNTFYNSRIGIRILIGQFISICEHKEGLFTACYPYTILNNVIDDINIIISDIYDSTIHINILYGNNETDDLDLEMSNYNFMYVPSFVYYILYEILKNSLEATYKNNKDEINIYISEGTDDIIIKISDQGKGLNKNKIPTLFSYCYSDIDKEEVINNLRNNRFILSGYGHGLPLSKLYAQYFGGDIQILTFKGIGTDTIIYLNKLLDNQEKVIF